MFVASECQWTASDVTGRVTKKSFVNTTLEGPAKKGAKEKNVTPACKFYNGQPIDTDTILLDGFHNTNHHVSFKALALTPKCDKSHNDCRVSKIPIGEESFQELSFWNNYQIIKCPGDDHCFVHAIVKSFNEDMLLQLIQWHTKMNAHLYVSCFESKQLLLWQMEKYILDKSYKSLFGDIVVFITTAALNVIVVVIEMKNDKLTKTEIKSRENYCNLQRLYVF